MKGIDESEGESQRVIAYNDLYTKNSSFEKFLVRIAKSY